MESLPIVPKKEKIKQKIFFGQIIDLTPDEVTVYCYDTNDKTYEVRSFVPDIFTEMDLHIGDFLKSV